MCLQTIYIDILLCVNLVVNFLLLSASAFYTHNKISIKRLVLGSVVGAVCSLVILLPKIPWMANFLLKIAIGGLTIAGAFGIRKKSEFFKLYAIFLLATFFFGGSMAAICFFLSPQNIIMKNGVVYLNISPIMMIISSVLCYILFRFIYIISGTYKPENTVCMLVIKNRFSSVSVSARIDTGNDLREPFSQCPVIVIGRKTAETITPKEILEYETVSELSYRTEVAGVRFVPFVSVGGRGILPCFKAEEVFINGEQCRKNIYIALCKDEDMRDFKAIVPYDAIL